MLRCIDANDSLDRPSKSAVALRKLACTFWHRSAQYCCTTLLTDCDDGPRPSGGGGDIHVEEGAVRRCYAAPAWDRNRPYPRKLGKEAGFLQLIGPL